MQAASRFSMRSVHSMGGQMFTLTGTYRGGVVAIRNIRKSHVDVSQKLIEELTMVTLYISLNLGGGLSEIRFVCFYKDIIILNS